METVRGVLAGLPPLELEELGDASSLAPQPEAPSPAGSVYTPVNAPSTYWRTTICAPLCAPQEAPTKAVGAQPRAAALHSLGLAGSVAVASSLVEVFHITLLHDFLTVVVVIERTQNYLGAFGLPSPMEREEQHSELCFPAGLCSKAVPTIVYKLRQRATLCMCISTIGSRQMEPSGSKSGNREPREAFERMEVLGSLEALEALIFSECSERQTRLQRASEQLRHLRRLERVALAGADVRRLAQLRQLQQELLEFADLRSLRSLRSRSGDHDGIPSEKAEKSVPSLLRDVRHWHAELRRLEQLEAFQLKSESSWSGPLTLTAEISVLRQVLAEQEEGRKACEECLRLRHPASSAALPLAGTPPSTLSACNASVAAGIRLATGAARQCFGEHAHCPLHRNTSWNPKRSSSLICHWTERSRSLIIWSVYYWMLQTRRTGPRSLNQADPGSQTPATDPGPSFLCPDKPEEKNLRRRLRLASDIVAETDHDCGTSNRNECGLQVSPAGKHFGVQLWKPSACSQALQELLHLSLSRAYLPKLPSITFLGA
ncbi:unnamed protein product [Symbiodinium necroappetens]|uniref:Uncharacterized protein n=1 Tax=Symbiodinium necroappetens TaxID=1628268 RepID=A0A813ANH0_9DINO|nr:unnamed protein product [Symbiodinium necroappetens]